MFFFFKQKTAYEVRISDWSSDVCSSDLTGAPFDSFLTLRGLRTLDARLRVHQENAAAIAAQLDAHPAVATVYYPGLVSHPGHALAAPQQKGYGAMLSVELGGARAPARDPAVRAVLARLPRFTPPDTTGAADARVGAPAHR